MTLMLTPRLVALAIALVLAGAAMADPPATIISDAGAGPVRIGMTWTQVQRALPGARREAVSDYANCHTVESDRTPGLSLLMQHGRVVRIDVSSTRYATASGVRVGAADGQVRAAYRNLLREASPMGDGTYSLYAWTVRNRSGVRFLMENGRVTDIWAGGSSIALSEGCET
jgi:hypothetical protein